jgi:DNA-binding NtrC family response regulator
MQFVAVDSPYGIVGQSTQIRQIRRQIEKLEGSRIPALLLGESGTGKEVVARALHTSCGRGAFIPIDCGSLVGPLMESELFGHTRGSFTGATEAKKGLIELANGGTAFFDEIGDLPLDLQVKLLRLIQEREYRPVGSLQRQKVDIRIIAATHRDLAREVARATFRQDLYYRLNVITIRLPPLRDRKEDIPLLVDRFLRKTGERYTVAQEAMDMLMRHDWPGNVRELHNAVERMVAMAEGPLLMGRDLPSAVLTSWHSEQFAPVAALAAAVSRGGVPVGSEPGRILPLHEVEKRAIIEALEETKGDRGVAAMMLGIGRTTLYRKLKEYSLESFEPENSARRNV